MENSFVKKCNRIGVATMIAACIANFLPAVYMAVVYGEMPTGTQILGVWGLAAAAYLVSWLTQPITFFSALGLILIMH